MSWPYDLHTTSSPLVLRAWKYLVPENQLPTPRLALSHFGAFLSKSISADLAPFFRIYLTFLKMMKSIVRWSIYLNLFSVLAERSMTRERPRLFSTSIMWQTRVTCLPSMISLASFAGLLKSDCLASWRALTASSSLGLALNCTVKMLSYTVWRTSAMLVMFIWTSFSK